MIKFALYNLIKTHDKIRVKFSDLTYRWNIFRRKLVGCVRNQQTCLAYGSVAYDNAFDGLHGKKN
jgi:hypothetical protein